MTVRRVVDADHDACARIAAALPDWFTPEVPTTVRSDLAEHGGWVVDDDGVVAFAVASMRYERAAEILWAAVEPTRRGSGLGRQLINAVLRDLGGSGVEMVLVKTLDPSADFAPYDSTFAFWLSLGFVQIDTVAPLPGWGAESPAAFLVTKVDGRADAE